MAEPLQAGYGLEPLPLPVDHPEFPSILHDISRGYNTSEVREDTADVKQEVSSSHAMPSRITQNGKERGKDMDELPNNNLMLVMPAIGLVLFLAALDMSIVATALPTIADELHATPSQYAWVGTAYTLAMTLQTPINGRVSDIVGRKPMLYAAIVVFTIFSALCGAAKSMTWLIVARAFQGLGGGSIIGLTSILVSDIVPLHKRGTYQGWLGGTWGIAGTLGPVLGGILTEKASWRWTFYINLPTCAIALVLLMVVLKLNPTRKYTFRMLLDTFDFLGLALVMAGGTLLIVGFSEAADIGFGDPSAYAVIAGGFIALTGAVINFLFTKRNAIIPARMFKNRTTLFFLLGSTFHAFAFIPSNYLLPQLFQGVRGASALGSGIQLLPYACCVAWNTVLAGQINSRLRIIRPVAWVGYALSGLGFSLFYACYTYPFSLALQEGLLVIAGFGIGLSLQVPMLILQAAMPLKEMAATTSAWTLTRSLGGSVGLAVFTAVLNTGIRSRFSKIEGYGTTFSAPQSASGYAQIHNLPEGPIKTAILTAFADSLRVCWIICGSVLLAALFLTLWTRSYSLDRARGPIAAAEPPLNGENAGHMTSASEMTIVGVRDPEDLDEIQVPKEDDRKIEKSLFKGEQAV
ncbi:MAG: hypothetical protein TREMPRED_003874 [Tremellales sp. Tagirdzhanova-0007]|nr:MAG: hypothetical protein TREMPRED_003874 [Tremellales sp. Tagirdzhanova-0007]